MQMLDLKNSMRNAINQPIGVDRTFNLGNYYVTFLVYKNQRVVRKESKKDSQKQSHSTDLLDHPIFLGPVLLQKDATYKTYKTFLEHIETELGSDIEAVELRLPNNIEFGTDDEKALRKDIDQVFSSATRFCAPNIYPRAGPGVERIGWTPPLLAQSVETWPIGVRLI